MPPRREKKEFQWTDDEAELLLHVAHEYKTAKASECTDWESVKSKYVDILALFLERLPTSDEERRELGKDFPHTKEEITKQSLTSKLKAIRIKFRQAVDSGRRSGHGRVVMLYYELCERVWGGSPATEQIPGGLESVDIDSESVTLSTSDEHDGAIEDEGSDNPLPSPVTVQHRRELISKTLADHRQKKLKRKLPVDAQLLDCAQEDLKLKKQLCDRMEQMDKQYTETMGRFSTNMEKLTNSISDGFSLLRNALYAPPSGMYPPHTGAYPGVYAPRGPGSSSHMLHPYTSGGQATSGNSDFDFDNHSTL